MVACAITTLRHFIKYSGVLGYDEAYVEEKFGAMINAFKFVAPPHAGCAFGVDPRMLMELVGGQRARSSSLSKTALA